ncbi:GMC oxidoreductase [Tropicimonas sp. S265A]|uniref:GMC family oxidoreductase n=1 Tax=Tropicimonas sp. S265A TaxID=3415134 RepID=UPI003C79EC75
MLIPATAVSDAIEAQVVIVGAGPAGIALTLGLAKRGVDVALLSSGAFGSDSTSADLSRAQALPPHHADPVALEGRRLGGLSWGWGGRCLPFDHIDFSPRPERELPGWPIERSDLMAHAEAAAAFLGIGSAEFQSTAGSEGLRLSLERWAARPNLAEKHRDALTAQDGPRVYTDLSCCGAEFDATGRVIALQTCTAGGDPVRVTGRTFVLAAGGIETARLLLWFFAQNGQTAPVWTGRGYMGHLKAQIASLDAPSQVIRQVDYQRTAECFIRNRLTLPEQTLHAKGLPNTHFWIDNPTMSDPSHGIPGLSLAHLAISSPVIGPRLLPAALRTYFAGQAPVSWRAHVRNVLRNPASALAFCYGVWTGRRSVPVSPGKVAATRHGTYRLSCAAEERPRFQNAVILGSQRDGNGVPRAVITRDLHPDDVQGLIDANLELRSQVASSGINVQLDCPENDLAEKITVASGDGYHQIGTARMGCDVGSSVVDRDCRVHGTGNLYVAGSAAFPRCGQANPTFSIACLSARLAAHLARN